MAKELIKATAKLDEGLRVNCEARGMSIVLDEPVEMGGTNLGMNPMECLLASIGGCKIIVAQIYAKAHNINLRDMRIDFEGEFDMDGLTGKNPDARVGYSKITAKYYYDCDNTEEELEKFTQFIDAHCPVMDTIIKGSEPAHEIYKMK